MPADSIEPRSVHAELIFVVDTGEKPVNYPSAAGGRLEIDTGTADRRGVEIENARLARAQFSLDRHGFEVVLQNPAIADFYDDERIAAEYTPQVAALLESLTGASEVFVFDHTRRTDDAGIRTARRLRDPSRTVHNDYTQGSAEQRVQDFYGARADAKLERRFAIVNVWRTMADVVLRSPIALCAARSVDSADLIATERRARDRIGETYRLVFNPRQRWYYFPRLRPDEALLIKTYDSATDGRARFTPHAAFDDPATPADAPPRQSIESRALVFF